MVLLEDCFSLLIDTARSTVLAAMSREKAHRERTLYWILGKFFSNTLPVSRSITHKRVDAENIGFLQHSIDIDILIKQEDLSSNPFVHLNMPGMYILYRVCSRHCNLLNQGYSGIG